MDLDAPGRKETPEARFFAYTDLLPFPLFCLYNVVEEHLGPKPPIRHARCHDVSRQVTG
jgi:hypothetical protein